MITYFPRQVKCDQYWPSRGTETYGLIQVTLSDTVELATYCVRTFALYKVYIIIYIYYVFLNWKAGNFFPPIPSFLSLTSLLSPCPPSPFCFLLYLRAFFLTSLFPFCLFPPFTFLLFPSSSTEHWDFYRVHFPDNMKFCKLMQSSHHEKPEY